jgi:hypothetical protein
MSFRIKSPFHITTHVKKYTSLASLVNKTKAGAIGFVGGLLYTNSAGVVLPVAGSGQVVASGGTARTLTAADNGSTNLFDSAAGITYTLPAPVVGLNFRFIWTVLQTSSAHVVVAAGASVFLAGAVAMFSGEDVTPSSTLGPKMYLANGTSFVRFTSNGTTTGGGIGSWLEFRCVSATIWNVVGVIKSPSGTLATPFAV